MHSHPDTIIHGAQQAFLVLGILTIVSSVVFMELRASDGEDMSRHDAARHHYVERSLISTQRRTISSFLYDGIRYLLVFVVDEYGLFLWLLFLLFEVFYVGFMYVRVQRQAGSQSTTCYQYTSENPRPVCIR